MNELFFELLIILALILVNGFFAAAEIAIISMRKSRTKELIAKGNPLAKIVADLQHNPETFLATIQVGITLVSTFASAFGGASLVEEIAPLIQGIPVPLIAQHAQGIAFISVVIFISYFSIVLGELVPKSLALRSAEKIALFLSYPVKFFSIVFFAFIKLLTASSNLVLAPFKDKTNFMEAKLSEEEIRSLIEEGRIAGTIEKREHEILENVFDFGDLEVGKIITPRNQITAFDLNEDLQEVIAKMIESGFSRIPVYKDQLDNIAGIIYIKDVLKLMANGEKVNLSGLIRPSIFIPATQPLHDVLQKFKKEKIHMAIVLNEHGDVEGLVTLEDLLEELVGEIADEGDELQKDILKQEDGSYVIEGATPITDFNAVFRNKIPEDESYRSVSGFLLDLIKRFPKVGEKITYKNLQFEVTEKTAKRIKKITVTKVKSPK